MRPPRPIHALLVSTLLLVSGCMRVIPSLVPKVDAEQGLSPDFPFESHYVDVLDSRMHYVDEGEGAPIVLLHGNPTSSYLWRNVIPHLTSRGRVIALDLIGMGRSGKPDIPYRFDDHVRYVDAFVEALDLRDVVFVLHDWGGPIGFDHALRNQDNVRGIAFMETLLEPFRWKELSAPERYLFRTMRSDRGDKLMREQNYFVERLIPAFSGRKLTEAEMAQYRAPYETEASREPTRVWPREVPFDDEVPADNFARLTANYERLKTSTIPLLLLIPDPGAILKPDAIERLRVDLPRMVTVEIGPGLHYVQETQPTAIGNAVSRWVADLP